MCLRSDKVDCRMKNIKETRRCGEMTETHYHISKPTACFMLDLNDLKMYEDKIRTKEEQKAKEKQEKK